MLVLHFHWRVITQDFCLNISKHNTINFWRDSQTLSSQWSPAHSSSFFLPCSFKQFLKIFITTIVCFTLLNTQRKGDWISRYYSFNWWVCLIQSQQLIARQRFCFLDGKIKCRGSPTPFLGPSWWQLVCLELSDDLGGGEWSGLFVARSYLAQGCKKGRQLWSLRRGMFFLLKVTHVIQTLTRLDHEKPCFLPSSSQSLLGKIHP